MRNGSYHILLIDDDVDMHDVVRLMLPAPMYRVSCCTTASHGLSLLRQDRPDALLLDIMLATPTEGLQLAERINRDPGLGGLPIILISSAPPGRVGQLPAGVKSFIEKPLQTHQLLAALRETLR